MTHDPNYECSSCGHRLWVDTRGTVEFSVTIGCPGCGAAMYRMDALGDLERDFMPLDIEALAVYNSEVARGIQHTPEWQERMRIAQDRFDAIQRTLPHGIR